MKINTVIFYLDESPETDSSISSPVRLRLFGQEEDAGGTWCFLKSRHRSSRDAPLYL